VLILASFCEKCIILIIFGSANGGCSVDSPTAS
jgi:hypothetical protein